MIFLYDSVKKNKIPFESIRKNEIRFYVCGPTVYDYAHLGHARSSIAFDLWRRLFLFLGYEVKFVKNFTDIDDKIIKKSLEQNIPIKELTEHHIKLYLDDMEHLNVLRADMEPKATEHLDSIQNMIQVLLDKGYAYKGKDGDVYLSIAKDKSYGNLSHTDREQMQSRIENKSDKLEHNDFALWKGYKGKDDISFESSFGSGRPGWHIECSAMIEHILAYENSDYRIDIHAGGADLIFPHHENEASQTRCATGAELAKYWLHNGFVNINGEKMSKSLGNSFFIKDALKVYDGEILRNYLLGVHYRSIINFNEEDLLQSKKRLDKLYRFKKRLGLISQTNDINELKKQADLAFIDSMLEALSDDLNISKALSVLENMLNESNEYLDKNPKDKIFKQKAAANLACIEFLLGLGFKDSVAYFQLGVSDELKKEIESTLAKRTQAKKDKNYALADSLRDELRDKGIEIMDTPQGSLWEKV